MSPRFGRVDSISIAVNDFREVLQNPTLALAGRAGTAWLELAGVGGCRRAGQILGCTVRTFLLDCQKE